MLFRFCYFIIFIIHLFNRKFKAQKINGKINFQVDPNFSYAYTLLGHEYLATEELDKAMSSFRNAIRICNRDYSAL